MYTKYLSYFIRFRCKRHLNVAEAVARVSIGYDVMWCWCSVISRESHIHPWAWAHFSFATNFACAIIKISFHPFLWYILASAFLHTYTNKHAHHLSMNFVPCWVSYSHFDRHSKRLTKFIVFHTNDKRHTERLCV